MYTTSSYKILQTFNVMPYSQIMKPHEISE